MPLRRTPEGVQRFLTPHTPSPHTPSPHTTSTHTPSPHTPSPHTPSAGRIGPICQPPLPYSVAAEGVDDVHGRRTQEHDDQRRQDADDAREDHLARDLHGLLHRPLPALEP